MIFRSADLQVRSWSWCGPGGPRSAWEERQGRRDL